MLTSNFLYSQGWSWTSHLPASTFWVGLNRCEPPCLVVVLKRWNPRLHSCPLSLPGLHQPHYKATLLSTGGTYIRFGFLWLPLFMALFPWHLHRYLYIFLTTSCKINWLFLIFSFCLFVFFFFQKERFRFFLWVFLARSPLKYLSDSLNFTTWPTHLVSLPVTLWSVETEMCTEHCLGRMV